MSCTNITLDVENDLNMNGEKCDTPNSPSSAVFASNNNAHSSVNYNYTFENSRVKDCKTHDTGTNINKNNNQIDINHIGISKKSSTKNTVFAHNLREFYSTSIVLCANSDNNLYSKWLNDDRASQCVDWVIGNKYYTVVMAFILGVLAISSEMVKVNH